MLLVDSPADLTLTSKCSKGRKHGGKLVVVPTDFSEVLDLRSPAAHDKNVVTSLYNQAFDKPVYSLANHPGEHECLLVDMHQP
jgi:hypothetical protein